jgi:tetratricopeptide (TPR) repeat protein
MSVLLLVTYLGIVAVPAQEMGLLINLKEPTVYYQRLFGDSPFAALKVSLAVAIKKKDKLAAAICLKKMGRICYHLGQYSHALDYYFQADKLFLEKKHSPLRAENLDEIGAVFLENDQPSIARKYFNEAMSIFVATHDTVGIAFTRGKIGHLFATQHLYDSAFYYQRLALNEYQHMHAVEGLAKVYGELGDMHENMKSYDSARYYFEQAFVQDLRTRDTSSCISTLNNLGDILRKTGQPREALLLTRQALRLSLLTQEQFHLGSIYRDLAKAHHLLANNDSAYYYQLLGQKHIMNVYSREHNTQLAVLKTLYEVEKKNNEIGNLRSSHRIAIAIAIIIFLLLLLGVLIISRQRLLIKNGQLSNEKERQAHEAQRALMTLEEQTLRQELELRSRELSTHTLLIIQKNQFLEKLQKQLEEMLKEDRRDQRKQLKQLQLQINQNINHGQHWDEFHGVFDQVHQVFFQKIKTHCDTLTRSELRLVALLRMNLATAEIATLLGISQDSLRVMRYRLRKKLNLKQGESLSVFIQSL